MRELHLKGKLPMESAELKTTYESKDFIAVLDLVPTLRVLDLTLNCDLKTDPLLITNICAKTLLLEEFILKDCRLVAESLLCLGQLKYLKKTMPSALVMSSSLFRGSKKPSLIIHAFPMLEVFQMEWLFC